MPDRRVTEVGPNADQPLGIESDEAALMGKVAQGDREAFEALYRCYFPRLRRFIERVTRRRQLVDDILNDTMLVVWRKANTFNFRAKVSTWIFAIAFRKALKTLKKNDEAVESDGLENAGGARSGIEAQLIRKELSTVIGQALASLSAEHRAVVELTYFHGCAYKEIAKIMDCPVDTIKTRMFYARRKLKVLLADRADDID